MRKIKVLYFVDRMLRGGIQSLVIDWVSRFDRKKIEVDFLLLDDGNKYDLEDNLKEMGCKVYKLKNIWVKRPSDYIRYYKEANKFFNEHNNYDVIHFHSSSKNYPILKFAKKYNIKKRISHSHNIDFQTNSLFKKLVGNIFKRMLIKYSTDYFACSQIAGEWLFGKKSNNKVQIIRNAVDYDKFKYNEEIRKEIRKDLNIKDDEILIGNVGRFVKQKNHLFLIDIFYEYQLKCNSKLLLIGTGELEDEIRAKVKKLKIEDKVIFLGFKTNVNDYMQAMDYFTFPSLFEGLGLVLIEAQAAGLTCFASKDVIPNEAKITKELEFISLDKTSMEWAEQIPKKITKRINSYSQIKENGYLIEDVVENLQNLYIK